MACAERYSKTTLMSDLNSTQMIALLSLPDAEETERFIAEKASEGKAVADMTIKQLREEIAGNPSRLRRCRQKENRPTLGHRKNRHRNFDFSRIRATTFFSDKFC